MHAVSCPPTTPSAVSSLSLEDDTASMWHRDQLTVHSTLYCLTSCHRPSGDTHMRGSASASPLSWLSPLLMSVLSRAISIQGPLAVQDRLLINSFNSFPTCTIWIINNSASSLFKYSSCSHSIICVSSSPRDPLAIYKKCLNSFEEFLC